MLQREYSLLALEAARSNISSDPVVGDPINASKINEKEWTLIFLDIHSRLKSEAHLSSSRKSQRVFMRCLRGGVRGGD